MNRQQTSLMKFARQRRTAQQGVVLLEALVAILLFSMGVLAVVGLQAAMIKNTTESRFRAEASYIAQQRIGQMWSDSGNLAFYKETDTDISAWLPNGTRTVDQPACAAPWDPSNCPFVITITWQLPGQAQHTYTITASIT